MATSWAAVWTLLAALILLNCCHFEWCEASRMSSFTSEGTRPDQGPSALERVKRGWVWNQFFVVEEYTGTEPLYVGKVRQLNSWCKILIACQITDVHNIDFLSWFILQKEILYTNSCQGVLYTLWVYTEERNDIIRCTVLWLWQHMNICLEDPICYNIRSQFE